MKCIPEQKWMEYLDGECSSNEEIIIQKHMAECEICKKKFQSYQKENELLLALLQVDDQETLNKSFLLELNNRMHAYQKSEKQNKNKSWWKIASAVVASLFIVCGILAYTSPAFADLLSFSFVRDLGSFLGITQKDLQNVSYQKGNWVEDKGIILHVQEVVADNNQIMVSYSLESRNSGILNPQNMDQVKVFLADPHGKILALSQEWRREKKNFGVYYFRDLVKNLPDKIYLKIEATKINRQIGNWNLSIPIDYSKAKSHLQTHELKKNFTINDVQINFQELEYSPTVTKLKYNLELSSVTKTKIKQTYHDSSINFRLENLNVNFRIVDEKQKLIATNFQSALNGKSEKRALHMKGTFHTREIFYQPFPKTKQLTLHVDSITRPQIANFTINGEQGKVTQVSNNIFTITQIQHHQAGTTKEDKHTYTNIVIRQSWSKSQQLTLYEHEQFIIQDTDGKIYHIRNGGISKVNNHTISYNFNLEEGKIPSKFIITPIIEKTYPLKNYSFSLPVRK